MQNSSLPDVGAADVLAQANKKTMFHLTLRNNVIAVEVSLKGNVLVATQCDETAARSYLVHCGTAKRLDTMNSTIS